jgi:uncharacterized membrane protein
MRYAELQASGRNPEGHNFLADWIPYWGRRVRELANQEIVTRRRQLKRQYGFGKFVFLGGWGTLILIIKIAVVSYTWDPDKSGYCVKMKAVAVKESSNFSIQAMSGI